MLCMPGWLLTCQLPCAWHPSLQRCQQVHVMQRVSLNPPACMCMQEPDDEPHGPDAAARATKPTGGAAAAPLLQHVAQAGGPALAGAGRQPPLQRAPPASALQPARPQQAHDDGDDAQQQATRGPLQGTALPKAQLPVSAAMPAAQHPPGPHAGSGMAMPGAQMGEATAAAAGSSGAAAGGPTPPPHWLHPHTPLTAAGGAGMPPGSGPAFMHQYTVDLPGAHGLDRPAQHLQGGGGGDMLLLPPGGAAAAGLPASAIGRRTRAQLSLQGVLMEDLLEQLPEHVDREELEQAEDEDAYMDFLQVRARACKVAWQRPAPVHACVQRQASRKGVRVTSRAMALHGARQVRQARRCPKLGPLGVELGAWLHA